MKNTEPKPSALARQEAGNHYKDLPIQPVEFCQRNGLGFCESSVIKYVARHKRKNGAEDVKKAIHFLELLLELEYPVNKTPLSEWGGTVPATGGFNPVNEDDLRILRDARIDKEAREIFPDLNAEDHRKKVEAMAKNEVDFYIDTDWISVAHKLPEEGQRVVARYEGIYSCRECTFWRDRDGGAHFGRAEEADGKGSQPATHWQPFTKPNPWKPLDKTEIKCWPMTHCCGYSGLVTSPHPVMWNPGNQVVQCHNCGHVYKAFNESPSYQEIIHAVETVHPGETRHQTALRYIRERESANNNLTQEGEKD